MEKKNLINNYMWKFIVGFSMGLYVGTYYNCKTQLDNFIRIIKVNIPETK